MRLLLSALLSVVACTASAAPSFEANANVRPYIRMDTNCNVDRFYKPNSRADVQAIIQEAAQQTPNAPLVKAMGRGMGPTFSWCPVDEPMALAPRQLPAEIANREHWLLQMVHDDLPANSDLKTVSIDTHARRAYVACGTRVDEVVDAAIAEGLDLAFGTAPLFTPMSTCGAINNAAHGSSAKGSGHLNELVEAIEVVDATGQIREYTGHRARQLAVNFGTLGVMLSVTLRLQPRQVMEVATFLTPEYTDVRIATQEVVDTIHSQCSHGQFNWFPAHKKFLVFCFDQKGALEDTDYTEANLTAVNYFFSPKTADMIAAETSQLNEMTRLAHQNFTAWVKQSNDAMIPKMLGASSPYLFGVSSFPAVAYRDQLVMTNRCDKISRTYAKDDPNRQGCAYEFGRGYINLETCVPLESLGDILAAFDSVRNEEFGGASFGSSAVSIVMRLTNPSGVAFLGPRRGQRVCVEATSHVPTDPTLMNIESSMRNRFEQIMFEVVKESTLFGESQAYLHTGKNAHSSFRAAMDYGMSQFRTIDTLRFERARSRNDPQGMFASEWARNYVLPSFSLGEDTQLHTGDFAFDGCALRSHCRCSLDRHCNYDGADVPNKCVDGVCHVSETSQ
ncbi:MAG: hypothetical protein MHM6MM_003369 [Cercozoa sp. M6MM]